MIRRVRSPQFQTKKGLSVAGHLNALLIWIIYGERRQTMAKKKGVSGKTHTKKQLDDYANQNNPNNKAYKANKENHSVQKSKRYDIGILEGESYGWCDD